MVMAGENDDRKVEQGKEILENNSCKQDSSSNSIGQAHDDSSCRRDEKIPRNQVCPCGSKKKCKTCCGSVAGRPSTKFLVNQTVDSSKGRKERKQGKKGRSAKFVPSARSSEGPPDVGALSI